MDQELNEVGATGVIVKTDHMMFISNFRTHATVWSVMQIDERDPSEPTMTTVRMFEQGTAFRGADGEWYMVSIYYFPTIKRAWDYVKSYAHDPINIRYFNFSTYPITDYRYQNLP